MHVAEARGLGGHRTWVLSLIAAQQRLGHEAELMLPPHAGAEEGERSEGWGIELKQWNREEALAGDVLHSWGLLDSELLAIRRLEPSMPVVQTFLGTSTGIYLALGWHAGLGWYTNLWRQRASINRERREAHAVDKVIAASPKVERELRILYRVPADKLNVVPGGHWNVHSYEKMACRHKLGLPLYGVLILFVGRPGSRGKGFHVVHECFEKISAIYRDAYLITAPSQGILGNPRVIAVELPSNRMPELYAACDISVNPTAYDGYSLATHEAMAYGLAAITTRSAGISAFCSSGHDSVVLARGSGFKRRFCQALQNLLDDPVLRQRLGAHAREAMAHRDWVWVAEQTDDLYAAALTETRTQIV